MNLKKLITLGIVSVLIIISVSAVWATESFGPLEWRERNDVFTSNGVTDSYNIQRFNNSYYGLMNMSWSTNYEYNVSTFNIERLVVDVEDLYDDHQNEVIDIPGTFVWFLTEIQKQFVYTVHLDITGSPELNLTFINSNVTPTKITVDDQIYPNWWASGPGQFTTNISSGSHIVKIYFYGDRSVVSTFRHTWNVQKGSNLLSNPGGSPIPVVDLLEQYGVSSITVRRENGTEDSYRTFVKVRDDYSYKIQPGEGFHLYSYTGTSISAILSTPHLSVELNEGVNLMGLPTPCTNTDVLGGIPHTVTERIGVDHYKTRVYAPGLDTVETQFVPGIGYYVFVDDEMEVSCS